MKKTVFFTLVLTIFSVASAFAEISIDDAEEKARKAHQLSESDVIYQQEDYKALYYQNIQIIQLLKDIREELTRLNRQTAKD